MPLIVRGNILQSSGRVDWLPDGNASQPSLTFSTDPDTGLYHGNTNELTMTVGGVDTLRIDPSGGTLVGQQPALTIAPSSSAQYTGSSLRLLNNANATTRRGVTMGTLVRDSDSNNSIFAIDVLDNANSVTQTAMMYDLSDTRWFLTGDTRITGDVLDVHGSSPSVAVQAFSNVQYHGAKLTLNNHAELATRRGATVGTYVRDADGTDSYFAIDATSNTGSYLATLGRYDLSDHRWSFSTDNAERLGIERDGNVTISGNCVVTADIVAFASDRRLKQDLVQIQDALSTVQKLTGYTYTWRDDVDGLPMRGRDMGLVAQDVQGAGLHECVASAPFDRDPVDGSSKSGNEYLTIQYNKLVALLVEAIKDLAASNDNIRARLDTLETRANES